MKRDSVLLAFKLTEQVLILSVWVSISILHYRETLFKVFHLVIKINNKAPTQLG